MTFFWLLQSLPCGPRETGALCAVLERAEGLGWPGYVVQHISELKVWDVILLQELSFKDELISMEELEASQLGDEPEMSVGHGHHHSLSMDGCHSLVCFVTVSCSSSRRKRTH